YFDAWEHGLGPGQPLSGAGGEASAGTPGLAQQTWNLATSVAAFIADGCRTITPEEFAARLSTCDGCDRRRENRCLACGCYLPIKARWRVMKCPLAKWPPAVEAPRDGPGVETEDRG